MPRIAFPTRAVSDETAQTRPLSQRVPTTQNTTPNTADCALPGSRLPVLPAAPPPALHLRNGVSEHVLLQTAQTPSSSQRVPATQVKRHPATRGGGKLNGQSKVLPCVFTGSVSPTPPNGCGRELSGPSLYREQRETNVKVTTYDVQRKGTNRTTKERKASGRSDRHCHLPSASGETRGACEIWEEPVDDLEENL